MALISSAASTTQTVTLLLVDFWLIDPIAATALRVKVLRRPIVVADSEDQEVLRPKGRRFPVVVAAEQVSADQIDLTLIFDTQADFDAFRVMRRAQRTLLVQTDTTDRWYVRLPDTVEATLAMTGSRRTRPLRTVPLVLVEVEVP